MGQSVGLLRGAITHSSKPVIPACGAIARQRQGLIQLPTYAANVLSFYLLTIPS